MKIPRLAGASASGRALAAILLASVAASPLAAQSSVEDVKAALESAVKAREEAVKALKAADEAIARAQQSLAAIGSPGTQAATLVDRPLAVPITNTPARVIADPSDKSEPGPAYADRAACGGTGSAEKMLNGKQRVFAGVGKDGQPLTDHSKKTAQGGLNWFSAACLEMTRYQDFTADAAIQFTGTKGDAAIEAGPILTFRRLKPYGSGEDVFARAYRNTYHTWRLQLFGTLGEDGNAALLELDKFALESGVGIKLGYEYGLGKWMKGTELRDSIGAAIAQARRDCIARYGVTDPLNPESGEAAVGYRTLAAAIASCEGEKLADFMSEDDRKLEYWKKMVRPLWGYDEDPVFFVGGELSVARSKFSYYPVYDAVTKGLLLTELPTDFLQEGGATKASEYPFAAQVYVGRTHSFGPGVLEKGRIGGALGLTYRREYAIPDSYGDLQVCLPPSRGEAPNKVSAAFSQCRKIDAAAPYEAEGLVAAAAVKFQLPRYSFLPPLAMDAKFTYAFDLDRWGIEAPVYLFNDSDGKLSSGVRFTCRGDGETRSGIKLEDECGAALFVGTKFKVGGAP